MSLDLDGAPALDHREGQFEAALRVDAGRQAVEFETEMAAAGRRALPWGRGGQGPLPGAAAGGKRQFGAALGRNAQLLAHGVVELETKVYLLARLRRRNQHRKHHRVLVAERSADFVNEQMWRRVEH